jgi:hypothetical protein
VVTDPLADDFNGCTFHYQVESKNSPARGEKAKNEEKASAMAGFAV